MKKRKWIHSKRDLHNTNRVLRLAKTLRRIFMVGADRWNGIEGSSRAFFIKHGRIYNPDFDCNYHLDDMPRKRFPPEYGDTLEELTAQGYHLKFIGYPGDGKEACWNNYPGNSIDLVVQMKLLERW